MKKFTTLAEFKGQLKEGNKLAIVIHTIQPNGKSDDQRYEGIVCEVDDNFFTYEYNTNTAKIKTTQWDQPEVKWSGSASLKKKDDRFCSVYHSNMFGQSSTIFFKGSAGCFTFAIHPDTPSHCPKCKGSGMSYTTIKELGEKEQQISIGTCFDCKGEAVNREEGKRIQKQNEAIDAMWCKCGHGDSYYVPDSKGMKHHWRCRKCKKITQIG